MEFYEKLNQIMTYDAGGRGLRAPMPDLAAVAAALLKAKTALILTGFPVFGPDDKVHGETDGPPGAAEIACALARLGCVVHLAADRMSFPLIQAAADVYGGAAGVPVHDAGGGKPLRDDGISLLEIPTRQTEAFAKQLFRREKIDLLVSIERPGRTLCGHFCSMTGRSLDKYVADSDCFLQEYSGPTIAIGDGGNELGMGKYQDLISLQVPHGNKIAAKLAAEHVLTAGVSNWWGGGLAALLSYETGLDLLADDETEKAALSAAVKAGAVDGCSGMPALSVDGLAPEVHLSRRALLRQLLKESRRPS